VDGVGLASVDPGRGNRSLVIQTDADDPRTAEFPLTEEVSLVADGLLGAEVDEVLLIWPQLAQPSASPKLVPGSSQEADVRLLVDGATIDPMMSCEGTYTFVVPAGVTQVWLLSRSGALADPSAPYLGAGRRLGVRVSEIAIRTRAGEVVIPADYPRLATGWHEAEQAGTGLWRWTDGLAELPWEGVQGPAVVRIRCMGIGDYRVVDDRRATSSAG
jgi:hypothetical protein